MRSFKPGEVQHYSVKLTVRSDLNAMRAVELENRTYVEPFTLAGHYSLAWKATRRVLSVDGEGVAEVEETLDEFLETVGSEIQHGGGVQELNRPMWDAIQAWPKSTRTLRYRESKTGHVAGLSEDSAPALDSGPAVLTLWLRRALRPTVVLPNRVAREGERWTEPRAVRLPPWTEVQGTETLEWLDGPMPELSSIKFINLHVVQQIAGSVPSLEQGAGLPAGQAHFHAESLNAVVHLGMPLYGGYGALYSATRSASREVTRVVDTVPNLNEPAVFRARISVEVRISVIE